MRVRIARARRAAGESARRSARSRTSCRAADKLVALGRILDLEDPTSALVFARTRGEVDELAERLAARGHDAAALHGGMTQDQRDRVMGRFRDGALDVLVATDVAARGLDIEHVSHVVNYDVPSNPEAYVHRIGRTGRAGREGVAITLVEPREHRLLRNIEAAIRTRLEIAQMPTVADLRERRLEILRGSLREAILAGGLDRFRAVVEPLAEEFDVVDVALAAVSLAEGAGAREEDEVESPRRRCSRADRRHAGWAVPSREGRVRYPAGPLAFGPAVDAHLGPPGPDDSSGSGGEWVQLFVGGGRRAGIRPGDLVGAITNEAGVPGSVVGAIQIADDFALVDVRASVAESIAHALRGATIRGRKLPVRRERG